MKKKLFNALSMLFILMIAISAFVLIYTKINDKIIFINNKAVVWVMTGSMHDVIPENSYILIEKVTDAETEIDVDSIITFYSNDPSIKGKLNTHKVVEVDRENKLFTTKGENNIGQDHYKVAYNEVVGRYVKNLNFLTKVGRFLRSTAGFVTVSLVLFGLACAAYLPDIINIIKKRDDSKSNSYDEEIKRRIAEEVERLKANDKANSIEQNTENKK